MATFTIPKSSAIVQNLPVGTFYSVTVNPDGSQTWNESTGIPPVGAILVEDSTPSVTTASGQTNTGFVTILGKTSGGLKVTTADATAFLVTATLAAQTTGTAALTIPDFGGVADEFTFKTKAQIMSNKIFVAPVLGVATGTSLAVTGAVTSSGGGVGYATGAGGAVTQLTDATTAVVLNKLSGAITTVSLDLAAGVDVSFTLTNSTIAATDVVVASIKSYGGTADGIPVVSVVATAAGSCVLNIRNTGAVTLDALAVVNYAVIKAVAA